MPTPSISLCVIAKNERHNIDRWYESVKGLYDEIHFTDTGSTDGTIERAKELGLNVHHFTWIKDFAAARNYSFSHAKTDFIMWNDLDDVLDGREAFTLWKENIMDLADYWVAAYHYALDAKGNPVCSFIRERVFRRNKGFKWQYFVHEGIIPDHAIQPVKGNAVSTWCIKHMRSEQDLVMDRSRNLEMLETRVKELDGRMMYYFGKELFENDRPADAYARLLQSLDMPGLAPHDRVLAIQYLVYALAKMNRFNEMIPWCYKGLEVDPNRAEFFTLLGDAMAMTNRLLSAKQFYAAAKEVPANQNGNQVGAIFSHPDCSNSYPRKKIAQICAQVGDFDRALLEVGHLEDDESKAITAEVKRLDSISKSMKGVPECEDIWITCPPNAPYEWDWDVYKEKGVGGSETAACEMAHWLTKLSGRKVKVFNARKEEKVIDGVHYLPTAKLMDYTSKEKPWVNIAWRHNLKVTEAPTFLWCHDLFTPGAENGGLYKKILALTPFHKRFLQAQQGIPADKILVTRNGLDPSRFPPVDHALKDPYKLVFPSSPDRGLDRAMLIMDRVVKEFPEAKLHVYYGIEHLDKWGHTELKNRLRKMMDVRSGYVVYHGWTDQKKLAEELRTASVWLHPCDFVETSCITAMEMACSGVYPVTRRLGGLMDTLSGPEHYGMATLLDHDCITSEEFDAYTRETINALRERKWERVKWDAESMSWENVAKEWLEFLEKERLA